MADRESETAGLEETAARADKGSTQVPRMAGMAALVELAEPSVVVWLAGLFVPVDLADPALVELADPALVELADPVPVDLADPALVDLAECSMSHQEPPRQRL